MPTRGGNWMASTGAALASIWIGVIVISLFAPSLVSGGDQEITPVAAAMLTLIAGAVITVFGRALSPGRSGSPDHRPASRW